MMTQLLDRRDVVSDDVSHSIHSAAHAPRKLRLRLYGASAPCRRLSFRPCGQFGWPFFLRQGLATDDHRSLTRVGLRLLDP